MEANVMATNSEYGFVAYQIKAGKYGVLETIDNYSELNSLNEIEGNLEFKREKFIMMILKQQIIDNYKSH